MTTYDKPLQDLLNARGSIPRRVVAKIERFLKPLDKLRSRFEIQYEEDFDTRKITVQITERIGEIKYVYRIPIEDKDLV